MRRSGIPDGDDEDLTEAMAWVTEFVSHFHRCVIDAANDFKFSTAQGYPLSVDPSNPRSIIVTDTNPSVCPARQFTMLVTDDPDIQAHPKLLTSEEDARVGVALELACKKAHAFQGDTPSFKHLPFFFYDNRTIDTLSWKDYNRFSNLYDDKAVNNVDVVVRQIDRMPYALKPYDKDLSVANGVVTYRDMEVIGLGMLSLLDYVVGRLQAQDRRLQEMEEERQAETKAQIKRLEDVQLEMEQKRQEMEEERQAETKARLAMEEKMEEERQAELKAQDRRLKEMEQQMQKEVQILEAKMENMQKLAAQEAVAAAESKTQMERLTADMHAMALENVCLKNSNTGLTQQDVEMMLDKRLTGLGAISTVTSMVATIPASAHTTGELNPEPVTTTRKRKASLEASSGDADDEDATQIPPPRGKSARR
jgi:hypothetical protein